MSSFLVNRSPTLSSLAPPGCSLPWRAGFLRGALPSLFPYSLPCPYLWGGGVEGLPLWLLSALSSLFLRMGATEYASPALGSRCGSVVRGSAQHVKGPGLLPQ